MSPFSSTCRGNLNQLVPSPPQALTPFFASLQSLRKHRLYPWFINSSNAPPEFNPVRRSYAAAPFHFLVLPQSSLSFIHQTQIQQNKIESGISAYWIQTGWREKNIDKGKGKMKEGKKNLGRQGFFQVFDKNQFWSNQRWGICSCETAQCLFTLLLGRRWGNFPTQLLMNRMLWGHRRSVCRQCGLD